jgi:2Fe-2S ferredoxin
MVKVHYICTAGDPVAIDVDEGNSVMEGALLGGVDGIDGICGGTISCGTCHVHITPEWLDLVGKPGESETDLLEGLDDRRPSSRLACQIVARAELDGLTVSIVNS